MPIRPRVLVGILVNKFDFLPAEGHSSDHRWFELQLPDLPVILTKVSHSKKEIRSSLENMIAKELRVRTNYFRGMIDCHNSKEDYYQKVREDPFPPWDHQR